MLNDTRVYKARLIGLIEGGQKKIELLLIEKKDNKHWTALVKNSRKIQAGTKVKFQDKEAIILDWDKDTRHIEFMQTLDYKDIDKIGEVPLPPYILKKRKSLNLPDYFVEDSFWYQSINAKNNGSVAAPTASLHLTERLMEKIKNKSAAIAYITLHVGPGTFKPIDIRAVDDFEIHSEAVEIPEKTIEILKYTRNNKKRIIAVGTTVVRALETMAIDSSDFNDWNYFSGSTNLFIKGEFPFKVVDAMITNFHMPKSTLLLLVQSFGGKELIQKAYKHAIDSKYRFLSYGDAMFIY